MTPEITVNMSIFENIFCKFSLSNLVSPGYKLDSQTGHEDTNNTNNTGDRQVKIMRD